MGAEEVAEVVEDDRVDTEGVTVERDTADEDVLV